MTDVDEGVLVAGDEIEAVHFDNTVGHEVDRGEGVDGVGAGVANVSEVNAF